MYLSLVKIRHHLRHVALCLLIAVVTISCSRTSSPSPLHVADTTYQFPQDWLGYWQGDIVIYGATGEMQRLPMALDLRATAASDRYHWAIIYGSDTIAGRRDYYISPVDTAVGHWQVDEQNSIIIDSYVRGPALVSAFEVQGNYLTSSYSRSGEELIFEILMMNDASQETGGGTIDSTSIPVVDVFTVKVRQIAKLTRRYKTPESTKAR